MAPRTTLRDILTYRVNNCLRHILALPLISDLQELIYETSTEDAKCLCMTAMQRYITTYYAWYIQIKYKT